MSNSYKDCVHVACPKCEVQPGESCKNLKKHVTALSPHSERIDYFLKREKEIAIWLTCDKCFHIYVYYTTHTPPDDCIKSLFQRVKDLENQISDLQSDIRSLWNESRY